MTPDKIDMCKCERCEESIDESADIISIGDFDVVCQSCADEHELCSRSSCDELSTDVTYDRHGNAFCSSCADDLCSCDECSELFDPNNDYSYEYGSYIYCNDCASDSIAYECHSCGCDVSVATAVNCEGYDFVIDEMCESCYDRRSNVIAIDSVIDTSIDKSVLDTAYIQPDYRAEDNGMTEAQAKDYHSFSKFFNRFFNYSSVEDYDKNKLIIKKGAFGYERWGWYETSVQIESELNEKIFNLLDYLITDNSKTIYRPHRKFGRYQPFAFAFAKLCDFYIRSDIKTIDGEYLFDDDVRYVKRRYPSLESIDHLRCVKSKLEDAPNEDARAEVWTDLDLHNETWLNYYVDFLDRAKLRECVKSRKMPDGKCLVKTMNKLISQHCKSAGQFLDAYGSSDPEESANAYKQTAHPFADDTFTQITTGYKLKACWHLFNYEAWWSKYCTNALSITIPARIGFDAQAHEKVVAFNDRVGACQGSSYKETLGFNHISMSSNPHLYIIFYDPDDETSIIGRSAIRLLWKRSSSKMGYAEPDKDTLFIAPSRMYLSDHTQAKNQFYAGMYKALNEWKDIIGERLGAKEVKMIAYHRTRHDNYSMRDYVANARDELISLKIEERDEEYNEPKVGKFVTDWFYPIWLEKPQEEAYWGYYPDEYQGYESAYVDSSVYSSYATRETYAGQYSLIEVKNE